MTRPICPVDVTGARRFSHTGDMGTSGRRPRKPKHPLPRARHYIRTPRYGGFWRLGGPLTDEHEAEAERQQKERPPGPIGRMIIRVLGGRSGPGR